MNDDGNVNVAGGIAMHSTRCGLLLQVYSVVRLLVTAETAKPSVEP